MEQELPIIQIRNCLLVSIQTELHDRLALDLQASLMERVRIVNARGVILDVSAVEIIDSYITRILNDIGKSVRFMGAECFIVGIRPAVAMTLIEMGVELDSVHTALSLDLALERLELLNENRREGDRGDPRGDDLVDHPAEHLQPPGRSRHDPGQPAHRAATGRRSWPSSRTRCACSPAATARSSSPRSPRPWNAGGARRGP